MWNKTNYCNPPGLKKLNITRTKKDILHLTLMVCPRVVGYISSTSCFIAAVPRNKSNCVPGGSNPERTKEKSVRWKRKQQQWKKNVSKDIINTIRVPKHQLNNWFSKAWKGGQRLCNDNNFLFAHLFPIICISENRKYI